MFQEGTFNFSTQPPPPPKLFKVLLYTLNPVLISTKMFVAMTGKRAANNCNNKFSAFCVINLVQDLDHGAIATKTRQIMQPSKKKCCPAQLKLQEVLAFPRFKVIFFNALILNTVFPVKYIIYILSH